MELRSGGNHFHFIQEIRNGSVVKTLNVFRGRPGLVFKKVCDLYGSEDGTMLHPSPALQPKEEGGLIGPVQARAKVDNPGLPAVERSTIGAYSEPYGFSCTGDVDDDYDDDDSERDSDLDEFGLGNMTLNQLRKRCIKKKRKRPQHSNNVKFEDGVCSPEKCYSTFQVSDEEHDLDEPLINWNLKLKKNIEGKKKSPKKCTGTSSKAVLPDGTPEESKTSQLFEQAIDLFPQPIAVTIECDLLFSPITNKSALSSSHENFCGEVFSQVIECCADVHVPSNEESKCCLVNEVSHGDSEDAIFPSDVDMTVSGADNLDLPCYLISNDPELGLNGERCDTNSSIANVTSENPSEDFSCEESGQVSECYDDAQIPSDKESQWCLVNQVPHEMLENITSRSDLDMAVLYADSVQMPGCSSSDNLISALNGEGCDTKLPDVTVSPETSNEDFSLETSDNCENDRFIQDTTLEATAPPHDDFQPMEQTREVLEGTVEDDDDEDSQIYQETGIVGCPINDGVILDDTSLSSTDSELSNGNDTPAAVDEMILISANVNEDQSFFSGIHPPRSAEEMTKSEGAQSRRDSNLHLASGRVLCTRKVISPTSQERLRKLMGYPEPSDIHNKHKGKDIEMDIGKNEESNQIRGTSTKVVPRRYKNDRKGLPPQGVSRAPQIGNSKLRVNSMQSCPKNAIAFSQRQMQDIDSLATKLMTELTSMRDIVEQTIISGANLTTSMKYSTDEMKGAVENAIKVEETAKKWVSMMSRDCNRFCKILTLSENGQSGADNVINKERKKIMFADEAGGKLCHVKYFEENTASPSSSNDEKQELLIN